MEEVERQAVIKEYESQKMSKVAKAKSKAVYQAAAKKAWITRRKNAQV